METSTKRARQLVILGADPTIMLDVDEQVLDQVPSLVRLPVMRYWLLPVRLRRDRHFDSHLGQHFTDRVRIVGFVARQLVGFRHRKTLQELPQVVSLERIARQQREPHQAFILVRQRQQVGIQTAFRLANCLRDARLTRITLTAACPDGVLAHFHETAVNHQHLEVQVHRQRQEHQAEYQGTPQGVSEVQEPVLEHPKMR